MLYSHIIYNNFKVLLDAQQHQFNRIVKILQPIYMINIIISKVQN